MRKMESLVAKTNVKIYGTRNAWSVDPIENHGENVAIATECEVLLEIQGTRRAGYNLVMSPAGFFSADHWYKTKAEAIESAAELFGVLETGWTECERSKPGVPW